MKRNKIDYNDPEYWEIAVAIILFGAIAFLFIAFA